MEEQPILRQNQVTGNKKQPPVARLAVSGRAALSGRLRYVAYPVTSPVRRDERGMTGSLVAMATQKSSPNRDPASTIPDFFRALEPHRAPGVQA
jgi:hypothetical protein